jgi:hypothetical protein
MRNLKDLLIILRRRLRKEKYLNGAGLCWINGVCYHEGLISFDEGKKIEQFINKNKPIYRMALWGWKPGVKAPRDRWLTQKINEL